MESHKNLFEIDGLQIFNQNSKTPSSIANRHGIKVPQLNLEKIKSQQTDYYKKNIPTSTPVILLNPKSSDNTLNFDDESWNKVVTNEEENRQSMRKV